MREYSDNIPVQYEDGSAKFMGLDIFVSDKVFIPRPETELLVSVVAESLKAEGLENASVLEMCTGSGAVAVALASLMPGARITAADISRAALEVAGVNIARHGVGGNVRLVQSDMFAAFGAEDEGSFDAVIANPPYVSSADYEKLDAWVKAEPRIALFSGEEGMDHICILARDGGRFLKSGGLFAVEIGYDQAAKTKKVFLENGFAEVRSFKDLSGYERIVTARKR